MNKHVCLKICHGEIRRKKTTTTKKQKALKLNTPKWFLIHSEVKTIQKLHCKKIIVKLTKYLGNFGIKTLGKICKLVCIFSKIGDTI